MATKATICKLQLNVADIDRGYYAEHRLTLARHPSETDQRMMARVVAFALNAGEGLEFGRGISTADEPDLWLRDLTGQIERWIEVGLPEPERLRKARGRSGAVTVYCYTDRSVNLWWDRVADDLAGVDNLLIVNLRQHDPNELATLAGRNMKLHCTVQEGSVLVSGDESTASLELEVLLDTVAPR